jgi:hypothetical protein
VRRSPALLALASLLALATPAGAHVPSRVRVAAPAEDARVIGDTVRVVLVGEGGTSAATFRMDIDGQPVDATGRIGGVFSTLSVRPNEQVTVPVPVAPGTHRLTVTPETDVDSAAPPEVRTFRVVADGSSGGGGAAVGLAAVAVLVALGAAVAVRRRAA